jgi:calcium-dependent protein kinase
MGCFESKPSGASNGPNNHVISTRDMMNLKNGSILDYYTIDSSPIASGYNSETRKGTLKSTGQSVAVNIISKAKIDQEKLRNEITILRNLNHPNIVKAYEAYQDKEYFYVVSELYTGNNLFEQVEKQGKVSEAFAASIIKQLLSAISYIHKQSVIHLSIRPENIQFEKEGENTQIKIVNFDTAETFRPDSPLKGFIGSPEYAAPEMIDGLYNIAVDIWACGVILYLILSGKVPFSGATKAEIVHSIQKGFLDFEDPVWTEISPEAKDLIRQMLDKDIMHRITVDQALQHPWFKMKLSEKQINQKEMKQVLKKLKEFTITKKLQYAIWAFISNYVVCRQEKDKLLDLFNALDTNKDGQLSKDELKEGFKKFYKDDSNKKIENIFKTIDKNDDKYLDYNEFVGSVMDKKILFSRENLEMAFKMLDSDQNGGISINELKDAFGAEAILLDNNYWANLLKEGDKNGDGEIQLDEFVNLMLKIKV